MAETSWSTATIYINDDSRHMLFHDFLTEVLRSYYQAGDVCNYYTRLLEDRGECLILFVEEKKRGILQSILAQKVKPFLEGLPAASYPGAPEISQSKRFGGFLFEDVPEKKIFYNRAKLRSEPFLYLFQRQRQVYYDLLRQVSHYIMDLSRDEYSRVLQNKFTFYFTTALSVLKGECFGPGANRAIMARITDDELTDAEAKLERAVRPGLQKSFERNRDFLQALGHVPDLRSESDTGQLQEHAYDILRKQIGDCLAVAGLFEAEFQKFKFVESLLSDLYGIVDFQMGLTCNYFLKELLDCST